MVRSAFRPDPFLADPAFVLAAQVQDLLQRLLAVKDPALGGGHQVRLAYVESEILAINRTLTKMRRTPIFPTDMSFELFRSHPYRHWEGV